MRYRKTFTDTTFMSLRWSVADGRISRGLKWFSYAVTTFIVCLIAYLGLILIRRHYVRADIERFYADERAIALAVGPSSRDHRLAKDIPKDKPLRILILEGGAIKGVISVKLMMFLEKMSGKRIGEMFDVISGISIGSLETIMLSVPGPDGRPKYSATDLLNFFRYKTGPAFNMSFADRLGTANGLLLPLLSPRNNTRILKEIVGDRLRVSDLLGAVLVAGYDIHDRKLAFFCTDEAPFSEREDFLVYQLLAGTAAMPGFMGPNEITSVTGKRTLLLADPGLILNNPIMAALVYATYLHPDNRKVIAFLGLGLEDKYTRHKSTYYYNGLLGLANLYPGMTAAPDKLFKSYISYAGHDHNFNLSSDDTFFIDDGLDENLSGDLDTSAANLDRLEQLADEIIDRQRPQLLELVAKLK